MKKILEGLWDNYLEEECLVIETKEEKELTKKVADKREEINKLLSAEQSMAIDSYVDNLCELYCYDIKKAFLKGCEFATSFLLEAGF